MNTHTDTQISRPFGYWVKAVDRLMAAEFARAFESEGATRRDWRQLNVVDGTAASGRPLHPSRLRRLVERGWVAKTGEGWTLTDEGRAAKERLGTVVDGIRAQVADAVSPEDYDTTVATLEQIARTFGWDENTPLPRRHRGERGEAHGFGRRHGHPFGRRHGFGPGFGHGFGPGADHGFGHDTPGAHDGDHGHHRHEHGHPAGDRRATQAAFERGFDAGYSRGRDA